MENKAGFVLVFGHMEGRNKRTDKTGESFVIVLAAIHTWASSARPKRVCLSLPDALEASLGS